MTDEFTRMFKTMVEQGQDMVRAFNPGLETFQAKGLEAMFPTMSRDMMELWFGKTFNREGLDANHALEAGATQREIAEVIWQMSLFGGLPAMTRALETAQGVFAETGEKSE